MGVAMPGNPFKTFSPLKISLEQLKLETSHLVCMLIMLIIASPSLQMTNCPWNGRGHVRCHILNFSPPKIYLERLKIETSKYGVHVDHSKSQPMDDKLSLKGAWSLSRDLFNFWKIIDNISKTVQDSSIVSVKFE